MTGGPRGGVSWQVDIPSLSQLIVSVGSYGLKQLALAGVDIHSIGCMLMIAEYTPCSSDFRKLLNRARIQQRGKRLWLYKLVEIGAATNFLADQLLKTRAGENVLALMTATASVLSEDTWTNLLGALFESSNVSLDNIPGTNQLHSIRSALTPLARKAGFGEKMFHYHHLLWALGNFQEGHSTTDPTVAIPSVEVLQKIIQMLHKLVTSDENYVVVYHGIAGAAWIATYSTYVLSLNTCTISPDGKEFPLLGNYADARIILRLGDSGRGACELLRAGDIYDHIMIEVGTWDKCGWSIDCSKVNYVDTTHPGLCDSPSFVKLSRFVAMEALNASSRVLHSFSSSSSSWPYNNPEVRDLEEVQLKHFLGKNGFIDYPQSQLAEVHLRCLKILKILGFYPESTSSYIFANDRDFPDYYSGHKDDPERYGAFVHKGLADWEVLGSGNAEHVSPLGRYFRGVVLDMMEVPDEDPWFAVRLALYINDPSPGNVSNQNGSGLGQEIRASFGNWSDSLKREVSHTAEMAAHLASHLAWTDWDESTRLLNVPKLSKSPRSLDLAASRVSNFEGNIAHVISLCTDNVDTSNLEGKMWSSSWIALDIDGLVAIRNAARSQSAHLRGVFLSLKSGHISYEGSPCYKICADMTEPHAEASMPSSFPQSSPVIPSNFVEDLSIRALSHNDKGIIWVRHDIILNGLLYDIADPPGIAGVISSVWVSQPCEHSYSRPFDLKTTSIVFRNLLQGFMLGHWVDMGTIVHKTNGIDLVYQQTDHNPLAQWLALSWQKTWKSRPCILQQDCCLDCILKRLEIAIGPSGMGLSIHEAGGFRVCVIASRS